MKRIILPVAALLLASGLLGSPAQALTVTGTVESITSSNVVIRTGADELWTMQLSPGVGAPAGTAPGNEVSVEYATSGSYQSSPGGMQSDYESSMPSTASPAGAFGLLGLLALAAGFIVRLTRSS